MTKKQDSISKTYIIIAIIIGVTIWGYGYIKFSLIENAFPAKQYLCAKGFVNCKVVAMFDNMDSCQYSVRQRSWYCDSRDIKNIICVEKESDMADMYCSNK